MFVICSKCGKCSDVEHIWPAFKCNNCGTAYHNKTALFEARVAKPLYNDRFVHGEFVYTCESCGRNIPMLLELGVEEQCNPLLSGGFSLRPHKPSPFTIKCPHCGGFASHTRTCWFHVPRRLLPGSNVFLYDENHECGKATYNYALDKGDEQDA